MKHQNEDNKDQSNGATTKTLLKEKHTKVIHSHNVFVSKYICWKFNRECELCGVKKIATKEGYDNNSKVDNEKKGVFACLM